MNNNKFYKMEYYRKKYGFLQSDMAKLLGIRQSGYSHKVNGITQLTFEELIIIMDAFNRRAQKQGHAILTFEDIFLDT